MMFENCRNASCGFFFTGVDVFTVSNDVQTLLGRIVRSSIEAGLEGHEYEPVYAQEDFSEDDRRFLTAKRGSFVTIKKKGVLRGCIGSIMGYEPLVTNVCRMAHAAAFQDPRFPPLQKQEYPDTEIEISILSEPEPARPRAIEIGRHGLILHYQGHTGVFLPQVPVEQGWDVEAYLMHLCVKAGVPMGSWRKSDAHLLWYEAVVFTV